MLNKLKKMMNNKAVYFFLVAGIFVLALAFRIVGANWGMPYSNLHPDEGLVYYPAYENVLNHTYEVHQYYRPNHVSIKVNTLLYLGIQELYFAPKGEVDFAYNFQNHIALFLTASRVVTALFGFGVVVFAYLIGKLYGKREALFAATLFAVFPAFILHSHYMTPDIPLLFFLMGIIYFALLYHNKPSLSRLYLMSLFTALATCEKYPGAFGCLIIAVTVILTQWKQPLNIIKHGLFAMIMYAVSIIMISPELVVDYHTVLEVMAGQNKDSHLGADGLNFGQTLLYYLNQTGTNIGLILSVLSIYGLIKSFQKKRNLTIITFTLFLYLFPISTLKIHWERYTLPLYAMGLFFGAIGAFYAYEELTCFLEKKKLTGKLVGVFLGIVLFLLPIGSLFLQAVATSASFLAEDSRVFLKEKFDERGITDENSVHDCNTPLDFGGFYGAFSEFEGADPANYKYGKSPQFVVTSSSQRDLFLEADQEKYGWAAEFYRKLDENYPMIYCYPVENPSSHFVELYNMFCAARTLYRYKIGCVPGFEIRVYDITQ